MIYIQLIPERKAFKIVDSAGQVTIVTHHDLAQAPTEGYLKLVDDTVRELVQNAGLRI